MTQKPENDPSEIVVGPGGQTPAIGSQLDASAKGSVAASVTQQAVPPSNQLERRKPEAQGYRFTDQRITQHLDIAINSSKTVNVLLGNISRIVSQQSVCLALWGCQLNENGDCGAPHLLTQEGGELWSVLEDHAIEVIKRVVRIRQICSSPLRANSEVELVAAPVIVDAGPETHVFMVLIGCFSSERQSVLRLQWLIGLVSQTIGRWHQQKSLESMEVKTKSLHDTIGLVHALDRTDSVSDASMVVVNNLRRLCNADQVSLALFEGAKDVRLKAISDVEKVDLNSESSKIISNALSQSVAANQIVRFPIEENEHSPAALALEKYCKSNSVEGCIGLPLMTEDERTIGAILVGLKQSQVADEKYNTYLERVVALSSGHLDVVLRANQGIRDLASKRWNSYRKSKLTKTIATVAACLAGLMFVPLPYRVACDCEIQPVIRRFIAAPYDGILEKSFVESGDIVEADQLVAGLHGSQLRIELSGLRAELEGARKRRDSALAQGEIAPSQIARSEMRRFQSKIEILEKQLTNLEVRSPIAGIVVSGDLEKVEGAPVETGKTLFEIAPLDNMLAEIGIPESEIQYVEAGMPVTIKLNAFPFKTWDGTIEKIHPRTEIVADESVFIAQVRLPNKENQLRPGMQGAAKIKSRYAPIGWNLFHQSWESVRYWLVW